jgi:hypothetical protein
MARVATVSALLTADFSNETATHFFRNKEPRRRQLSKPLKMRYLNEMNAISLLFSVVCKEARQTNYAAQVLFFHEDNRLFLQGFIRTQAPDCGLGNNGIRGPNVRDSYRIFQLTGHGATDKFTHYPLDPAGHS